MLKESSMFKFWICGAIVLLCVGCVETPAIIPRAKFQPGDIAVDRVSGDKYIIVSGPDNDKKYHVRVFAKPITEYRPYADIYEVEMELEKPMAEKAPIEPIK